MAFMKLIKKKDKRNAPSCPCSFPEEKTAAGSVNEKTDASDAFSIHQGPGNRMQILPRSVRDHKEGSR